MSARSWVNSHTKALIALSIGLVVLSVYLTLYATPVEVRTYVTNFNVSDSEPIGIDVRTDVLSFGRLHPGTIVHRDIDINNTYDFPVTAKIYLSKSIAPYISISPNPVVILPRNSATVGFTLTSPLNVSKAFYEGITRIEIFK